MPKMNPNAAPDYGDDPKTVPAGRYGLALVWFQRRPKKAGGEYLSVKYEITDGPMKGRSFFSMMGLNLSQNGTVVRWNLMCEVCGVDEEFEIGDTDEGTADEGDQNIARLFRNKPFRGEVVVEQNGDYTNNTVKRIIKPDSWTAEEKRLMAVWETEQAEARDDFGVPDEEGDGGIADEEIDAMADEEGDDWQI